jgi:hypothetical protein
MNKILRVTSPAPRDVWRELYTLDAEAIPYQSPNWLDCICASGEFEDASRLYEMAGGRRLLLPLVRRHGLSQPIPTAASLPHGWGIGGLLSSSTADAGDIAAVLVDLASLPYVRVSLRPNPRAGATWADAARSAHAVSIPRLAHVLDLEGGFDKVWKERFDKHTRSQVRKAERCGVIVECDTTGRLIPVFYDLLCLSFERWAQQQHEPPWLTRWRGQRQDPLRKFQAIAHIMGEACRVWVAWVDGHPAAAIITLQIGNTQDSRGAMDKELAGPVNANDLLQKMAIEDACRAGARYYHMGESGQSASLAHFKERFGAVAYSYAEYYMEKLPVTSMDRRLRSIVKRLIGFRDA